jgi:hypothetical protein
MWKFTVPVIPDEFVVHAVEITPKPQFERVCDDLEDV